MKYYSDIWLAYQDMVKQELSSDDSEDSPEVKAGRISKKIAKMLPAALKAIKERYNADKIISSQSSEKSFSDDSEEENYRIKDMYEQVTIMLTKMHRIKSLCNRALKIYKDFLEEGIDKIFIIDKFDTYHLSRLQSEQQALALKDIRDALDQKKIEFSNKSHDNKPSHLTKAMLEDIIKNAIESHEFSHEKQAREAAEQRAEAEKQRAEAEKQAKEQIEQKMAIQTQETDQKLAAQAQEIERLKAMLTAQQGLQNLGDSTTEMGPLANVNTLTFFQSNPDNQPPKRGVKRPSETSDENLPPTKRRKTEELEESLSEQEKIEKNPSSQP